MGTRAQICIKRDTDGFKDTGGIYIYKHSDGYPEGVMSTLEPLARAFVDERGYNPDYLLATIIRRFAIEDAEIILGKDVYRFLGWGLDTVEHGDIEYLYEVDATTGKIFINGKVQS